jgi:hypothetical protein
MVNGEESLLHSTQHMSLPVNVVLLLTAVTMKIEEICSFETSVLTTATWYKVPEDIVQLSILV